MGETMEQRSTQSSYARYAPPLGGGRVNGHAHNVAYLRTLVTLHSTEKLIALCAARNLEPQVLAQLQRILCVTVQAWSRRMDD
jgi:hypothetical protein